MQNRIVEALPSRMARVEPRVEQTPGFMICPLPLPGSQEQIRFWLLVYQIASEQARAATKPSRLQRYCKPIWN